jgi:hypothetical protein
MECVDAATARQRHGNNMSAQMDTHATIEELLETMFSMWSMPWLYNEGKRQVSLVVAQLPES